MSLTRAQVHGFVSSAERLGALGGAAVVARMPDGTEFDLPIGTGDYLADAYRVADRAGSCVSVAGDGETVSAREAAKMLGVSRPTIYKWVQQGKLAEQRDTADHRIYTDSIERVLERRRERHQRVAHELANSPDSDFSRTLLDEARGMRDEFEA